MKYIAFLLAILLPICSLIMYGDSIKSFSTLVNTNLNFMFVLLNITTGYCFINLKYWEITGWILILLTAFNVEQYHLLHNFLGTLFFISCALSIYYGVQTMRKWIYGYVAVVLLTCWFGLFWMETALVYFLVVFHKSYIDKFWRLKN
jgi:hypothetical protein